MQITSSIRPCSSSNSISWRRDLAGWLAQHGYPALATGEKWTEGGTCKGEWRKPHFLCRASYCELLSQSGRKESSSLDAVGRHPLPPPSKPAGAESVCLDFFGEDAVAMQFRSMPSRSHRRWLPIALWGIGSAIAASGCQQRVYHDLYSQQASAEIRALEDRIYEYDSEFRTLEEELVGIERENQRLRAELQRLGPSGLPLRGNSGATSSPSDRPRSLLEESKPPGKKLPAPSGRAPVQPKIPQGSGEEIDLSPPVVEVPKLDPTRDPLKGSSPSGVQPPANVPLDPPPSLIPSTLPKLENDNKPSQLPLPEPRGTLSEPVDPSKREVDRGSELGLPGTAPAKLPEEPLSLPPALTPPSAPGNQIPPLLNPPSVPADSLPLPPGQVPGLRDRGSLESRRAPVASMAIERGRANQGGGVVLASAEDPMPSVEESVIDLAFHPGLTRVQSRKLGDWIDGVQIVVQPRGASGGILEVDGVWTAAILDSSLPSDQSRIAIWEIDAEGARQSHEPSGAAQGYHFLLPWQEIQPVGDRLQLHLRLQLPDGRTLVSQRELRGNGTRSDPGSSVWVPRRPNSVQSGESVDRVTLEAAEQTVPGNPLRESPLSGTEAGWGRR